jgi:hypothetical protein
MLPGFLFLQPQNDEENTMRRHPSPRAANSSARPQQGPIRRPDKLPLLDAICKKLNQRVNLEDEQRVLGVYERGWIFKGVLGNLSDAEARYVRALATRYNSWIARQVA